MSERGRWTGRRSGRRGFTLVELLVAVVVLAVGVLALASTASTVLRMLTAGAQQTVAAHVAQSRFERLRALPCAQVANGSATTRGVTERWRVATMGNRSFAVVDSVSFLTSRGRRTEVYRSVVRC